MKPKYLKHYGGILCSNGYYLEELIFYKYAFKENTKIEYEAT